MPPTVQEMYLLVLGENYIFPLSLRHNGKANNDNFHRKEFI